MSRGTPVRTLTDADVEYTDVDLNASGTTTVYDGNTQTVIYGVFLKNGGSTAVVQLEVTDGTDTAVLTPGQTAGDGISFTGPIALNRNEALQANVTTVEGSAQTNTAAVSRDEQ